MKKKISILMACILLLTPFSSYAESAQSQTIANEVLAVTKRLEQLMQKSYNTQLDLIKKEISENQYDYELTMETTNIQGNPFSNMDYVAFIAAYTTAKEFSDHDITIHEVTLIDHTIKKQILKESIPIAFPKYVKNASGTYYIDGKEYITKNKRIDIYERTAENTYIKTGMKEITLKTQTITYGEVTFHILEPESLLRKYNANSEEAKNRYEERKAVINRCISGSGLAQSIGIHLSMKNILDPETLSYITLLQEDSQVSENKKAMIQTATALIGKIPYEWGGKADKPGYDDTWWTFKENGKQKGLDCSGFVEWVFRTAGYPQDIWNNLHSTSEILKSCVPIAKNELEIGDLGLLNTGEGVNHVGIYLGNDLWIHCSSSENTVVINRFHFRVYRRVESIGVTKIVPTEVEIVPKSNVEYTEEDIYLLAQTMAQEAAGEGMNGWIAVGEVVVNRIHSEDFGNTVADVIYEQGQFENADQIATIIPDENIVEVAKMVLHGSLRIFHNADVLYFRNPSGDPTSDWGPYPLYKKINHHAFYLGKNSVLQ